MSKKFSDYVKRNKDEAQEPQGDSSKCSAGCRMAATYSHDPASSRWYCACHFGCKPTAVSSINRWLEENSILVNLSLAIRASLAGGAFNTNYWVQTLRNHDLISLLPSKFDEVQRLFRKGGAKNTDAPNFSLKQWLFRVEGHIVGECKKIEEAVLKSESNKTTHYFDLEKELQSMIVR